MSTQQINTKIKHTIICENCGRPATRSIENTWTEYDIDNDGEFTETDSWEGNGNIMLCDDCELN